VCASWSVWEAQGGVRRTAFARHHASRAVSPVYRCGNLARFAEVGPVGHLGTRPATAAAAAVHVVLVLVFPVAGRPATHLRTCVCDPARWHLPVRSSRSRWRIHAWDAVQRRLSGKHQYFLRSGAHPLLKLLDSSAVRICFPQQLIEPLCCARISCPPLFRRTAFGRQRRPAAAAATVPAAAAGTSSARGCCHSCQAAQTRSWSTGWGQHDVAHSPVQCSRVLTPFDGRASALGRDSLRV
jgi:hypothetical protein